MTDATLATFAWLWKVPQRAETDTSPPRRRVPGPVFLHDAVVPWAGGTVLLHEWRAAETLLTETDEP
jgi:hypothetical protein